MLSPLLPEPDAVLLLTNGTALWGRGFGAPGTTGGELCFNTAMTGYQEILTDPSYSGQIITFTTPHIGNTGINGLDVESTPPHGAAGLIVREMPSAPSNYRSQQSLHDWLLARALTGISGIDTRTLTRRIREHGASNVAIAYQPGAAREMLLSKARTALAAAPAMQGLELAAHVTTREPYRWHEGPAPWQETAAPAPTGAFHVVAIDYGVKHNILRCLVAAGCELTVMPATAAPQEILALQPDGIFLSNGPGDPAATAQYAVPAIRALLGAKLPVFGICLGHQLLGLALGARTQKMPQGHRGANHPVKDLQTGKVEITSQNHGFCIADDGLPAEVIVTHRSLFDGTIQGIRSQQHPAFSVQGHPEASPGPQDSHYLFTQFVELMQQHRAPATHRQKKGAA